jgi:hypothetical protein
MKTDSAADATEEKIGVIDRSDASYYGYIVRQAGKQHYLAMSTAGSDSMHRSRGLTGICVGGAKAADDAIEILRDHWSRRTGRTIQMIRADAPDAPTRPPGQGRRVDSRASQSITPKPQSQ